MKTLIFLHGWTSNKDNLSLIQNWCKEIGINFYSFDFLLHGDYKQASYDYDVNFETLVRQARHELKNFYNDEVILVGHSMGGAIALIIQQEFENIEKLILIDPLTPNQEDEFVAKIKEQIKPNLKRNDEKALDIDEWSWRDVANFVSKLNEYSMENRIAIVKIFASFKSKKFKSLFENINGSSTAMWYLIHGTNDQFLNYQKTIEWLQKIHSNIEISLIPNADHSPFKSQPEVFLKTFQEILLNDNKKS